MYRLNWNGVYLAKIQDCGPDRYLAGWRDSVDSTATAWDSDGSGSPVRLRSGLVGSKLQGLIIEKGSHSVELHEIYNIKEEI